MNNKLNLLLQKHNIEINNSNIDFIKELSSEFDEKDFFQSLIDEIPCTISFVNKDLTYIGVNNMLANQMGKNKEDFIGQELGEMTNDNKFNVFAKKLFEIQNDSLEDTLSVDMNGYKRFFYVIGKKYAKNNKATIIGLDITEMKKLEAEHNFNSQLVTLGEVNSQIMHEINNPLAVISMSASSLGFILDDYLDKDISFDEAETKIRKIQNQVVKMVQTISLIIDGTKKMATRNDNEVKSINLKQVVDQAKLIGGFKAQKKDVCIESFVKEDIIIDGNYINLMQVFINLISNSCDAVEHLSEKWIKISNKDIGEFIELSFIDSGNGISKDIGEKIFDSFYSSKPIGEGNGIGLNLSRKIIESHNGKLEIDYNNKNTTFTVKLPKNINN